MSRTLEEILNTPVEFKEGMRVLDFIKQEWGILKVIKLNTSSPNHFRLNDDTYTADGRYVVSNKVRRLLTEQEAYELFPSLKPKVYEYQAVYKVAHEFDFSREFCVSEEEFREIYKNDACVFIELYQPSKRERK